MGTANFHRINARNFYVLNDTTTYEDENGNEVETYKDNFDIESDIDYATEIGEKKGYNAITDRYRTGGWDGRPIMAKSEWYAFGDKSADESFNQFRIERTIYLNSGYYSGGNYDWELRITTNFGQEFCMSEYNNESDMASDIADRWQEDACYYGFWSEGLASMQRKNFEKWMTAMIDKFTDEADDLCKEVCEDEYKCTAVFSNGEAMYEKVG